MIVVYILLLVMIIIWSLSFIVVDIAVEFTTPVSLALYRFLLASLSFLLIDIFMKLKNKKKSNQNDKMPERFSRFDWLLILIASFTGASIFFFAQYTAILLIGPSLPALFACLLAPILITILSIFIFDEKLDKVKIFGFSIASIGGFLLITGGDIRTLTPESPLFIGFMLALATPVLWAVFSVSMKKISKSKENSELQVLKYISYLGTIELLIFVILINEFEIFIESILNPLVFLSALYLGLGCYIGGYYIWQNSQKKLKSSKVASFLYLEPFLTLFLSLFVFQRTETIVLWNILGGIIVLVAVLIINYK